MRLNSSNSWANSVNTCSRNSVSLFTTKIAHAAVLRNSRVMRSYPKRIRV